MLMDWGEGMFWLSGVMYVLGAVLALGLQKQERASNFIGHGCTGLGALFGIGSGMSVWLTGRPLSITLPKLVPFANFSIALDHLGAFFLLVISLATLVVSVYATGYVTEYYGKKNVGYLNSLFNLFILSMVLVVSAGNAFMFLLAWEIMSLVSYFLVTFEHEEAQVRSAGFIYVIMTHIGTAFIILAFLLLYKASGTFDFSGYRAVGATLPTAFKSLIFLLVLVGFGTKAGLIPLHIWLPRAHPVAPSHVSALMSGVMIKTAVYGFLRVVLDILGDQALQGGPQAVAAIPAWWGITLLILGTVSAVLGVMYALMEQDIKRLLAFSSVENMGIIFIGIGATLLFMVHGQRALAAVALFASLYHLLNHSVFKSLLFMGAGSILYATHTRNMEKLGGLIRYMPQTAFFFLIGSLAVSALPPFNGFIGEWLTIQALLLLSVKLPHSMVSVLAPLAGTAVALTGALVAGGFVKAFGITFLAMPRSEKPAKAHEVPAAMRIAMGIMALLCLVLGVTPGLVSRFLNSAVGQLAGVGLETGSGLESWLMLTPVRDGLSSISPLTVLVAMAVIIPGAWLALRALAGKTSRRVDETWGCGVTLEPRMEYTGTSFSKPVRIIFKKLLEFDRKVETSYDTWSYFPKKITYRAEHKPFFESRIYGPLTKLSLVLANLIRRVQTGSIHSYLAYILVTLVVLLAFAR